MSPKWERALSRLTGRYQEEAPGYRGKLAIEKQQGQPDSKIPWKPLEAGKGGAPGFLTQANCHGFQREDHDATREGVNRLCPHWLVPLEQALNLWAGLLTWNERLPYICLSPKTAERRELDAGCRITSKWEGTLDPRDSVAMATKERLGLVTQGQSAASLQ